MAERSVSDIALTARGSARQARQIGDLGDKKLGQPQPGRHHRFNKASPRPGWVGVPPAGLRIVRKRTSRTIEISETRLDHGELDIDFNHGFRG